jgi:hypothetical protein
MCPPAFAEEALVNPIIRARAERKLLISKAPNFLQVNKSVVP